VKRKGKNVLGYDDTQEDEDRIKKKTLRGLRAKGGGITNWSDTTKGTVQGQKKGDNANREQRSGAKHKSTGKREKKKKKGQGNRIEKRDRGEGGIN